MASVVWSHHKQTFDYVQAALKRIFCLLFAIDSICLLFESTYPSSEYLLLSQLLFDLELLLGKVYLLFY